MLINSLMLFIEETLPIFILYAYINAWEFTQSDRSNEKAPPGQVSSLQLTYMFILGKNYHHLMYISAIILGLLFSYLLTSIRPWLGSSYTGTGYEALLVIMTIICVITVVFGLHAKGMLARKLYFSISLFTLILPHASDFIVFFDSVSKSQLYSSITIGAVLGLGICASISYLLFFLFLNLKNDIVIKLAVSVFLAGQLSNVVNILQQIDVLPSSLPLWNTNEIIADRNEFGQFFHVLFGYDATPTLAYLAVLILSFLILFAFLIKTSNSKKMQIVDSVNGDQL